MLRPSYAIGTRGVLGGSNLILPVLLVAVAVSRLCVVFFFPRPFVGDMLVYENLALNVLNGHGLAHGPGLPPTATQTPLFPLFLSGVYSVFGTNHVALFLIQTLIDIGTALLIYLIARRIFQSRTPAYVAVLLWAAYLPAAELAASVLSETLFIFLMCLSLYLTVVFTSKSRVVLLLFAGILLGLAAQTRPCVFGFPAVLILGLLLFLPRRRLTVVACLVYLLGLLVVLTPWAARNYRHFNAIVPLSSIGGVNLYKSIMHIDEERNYTRPGKDEELSPEVLAFLEHTSDELERDRFFLRQSLMLIRDHPLRYIETAFHKFPRLWFNVGHGTVPSAKSLLFMGANLLLMGFAAVPLFSRGVLRNVSWVPLLAFVLYTTLFHMCCHALGRFSIPAVPALIVFASPGFAATIGFIRTRVGPQSVGP